MLLHLKTGDGDLLPITEPALLTRCAWESLPKKKSSIVLVLVFAYKKNLGGQWLAQFFQLKNLCEKSARISPVVAQANKTTLFSFLFKNEE